MILQIERQWPISKLSGSFGFYLSNQNRLKCFGTCLERPEMADFSWSLWSLLFDDFEGIVRTSPFVRFGSYSKPTNLNQLSTSWWKRDPKIKGLSWPTQPGAFPKVTAEKSLGGWMFFSEWPNIYHFGQPPRHPPAPPPHHKNTQQTPLSDFLVRRTHTTFEWGRCVQTDQPCTSLVCWDVLRYFRWCCLVFFPKKTAGKG